MNRTQGIVSENSLPVCECGCLQSFVPKHAGQRYLNQRHQERAALARMKEKKRNPGRQRDTWECAPNKCAHWEQCKEIMARILKCGPENDQDFERRFVSLPCEAGY